jgi:hypothetical protein
VTIVSARTGGCPWCTDDQGRLRPGSLYEFETKGQDAIIPQYRSEDDRRDDRRRERRVQRDVPGGKAWQLIAFAVTCLQGGTQTPQPIS